MLPNTTSIVDPITFIESHLGLGIPLYPVQNFVTKCYYGLPLDDKEKRIDVPDMFNEKVLYSFTEVEFLQWLYDEGRCNTNDAGREFTELVFVVGRRGGKSELLSLLLSYETYLLLTRGDLSKHYGFPLGTQVSIMTIAPTDDQVSIVFNSLRNKVSKIGFMKDRLTSNNREHMRLKTDSDSSCQNCDCGSVVVMGSGCSSSRMRGHNGIVIAFDEMAFFEQKNDWIYESLKPSVCNFNGDGKIICVSSPYLKQGIFWNLYMNSFNDPRTLMFKMYSSLLNPTLPSDVLRAEHKRDPEMFTCEFGGEFRDGVELKNAS